RTIAAEREVVNWTRKGNPKIRGRSSFFIPKVHAVWGFGPVGLAPMPWSPLPIRTMRPDAGATWSIECWTRNRSLSLGVSFLPSLDHLKQDTPLFLLRLTTTFHEASD